MHNKLFYTYKNLGRFVSGISFLVSFSGHSPNKTYLILVHSIALNNNYINLHPFCLCVYSDGAGADTQSVREADVLFQRWNVSLHN